MPTRKPATHNKLTNWLLRSLLVVGQRSRASNTGFVLPTVVMVTLVVVLLTTALVIRSFDRSKNASNTRVNEVSLNASSPAIDRAKAKLNALFEDPTLPRATPSDTALYRAIRTSTKYTFGDETRLKVGFDLNNDGDIDPPTSAIENDETLTTAWRFPVDTDNNGRFDSYTLYGVFFRSPTRDPATGTFNRARTPLEARTPPMDDSTLGGQCANALGTSASLVGDSGWYKAGGKLKKSFFVYTATVPITNAAGLGTTFEAYKGNKGFSALEFQQDRGRIPLSNNAVVYEDDLQITPGPGLKLNGRVFTNSNLLIRKRSGGGDVKLYQVSSKNSCYYEEETGKIVVGGNVGSGAISSDSTEENAADAVNVHLFRGKGVDPNTNGFVIDENNKTTSNAPRDIAYNSQAYIDRVNFLVDSAIARGNPYTVTSTGTPPVYTVTSGDPQDIQDNIKKRLDADASLDPEVVRRQELETYFRQRVRRVPFLEVPFGENALFVGGTYAAPGTSYSANTPNPAIFQTGNPLRPPNEWMFPTNPTDGLTGTGGYTGLTLSVTGTTLQPPMLSPTRKGILAKEMLLGDRMLVGNNLPEIIYDTITQSFKDVGATQNIPSLKWNNDTGGTDATSADNPRKRTAVVSQLADLGITDRDGFWEKAAAQNPANVLDNIGGLRIVTGAGIYSFDRNATAGVESSFLPAPPTATYDDPNTAAVEAFPVVWPDSMPMWQDTNNDGVSDPVATDKRGDLVMRASAVYHFRSSSYDPSTPATYQTPIACVSSYYDPSTSTTASNATGLPFGAATGGRSNNGISYGAPTTTAATLASDGSFNAATRVFTTVAEPLSGGTIRAKLNYQANLVYPSGRFVNEQLRQALINRDANKNLTLAEQSAIDSAVCAVQIKDGTIAATDAVVPHGAIRETSFLNAEQIKSVDRELSNVFVTGVTGAAGNKAYTVSFSGTLAELQALLPNPSNPAATKGTSAITIKGFANQQLNATRGEVTSITGAGPYTINVAGSGVGTESGSAKIVEALTGKYDRSIEERQPLEVRATVLDLQKLRTKTIGGASPAQEYLLPNSGIIYATRDDALADSSSPLSTSALLSDAQKIAAQKSRSPVDFKLDPSRRPSAILLENGSNLSRVNNYRAEEKGLILASNVPAYIKGAFNLHTGGTGQEFNETLTGNWTDATFYDRSTPNQQFACRPGQFGPGSCSPGDSWRPATVLADSVSLLSDSFRYGFRDEGGYDLRNNQDYVADAKTKRLKNGFWDNDFAINGLSSGGITAGITDSSYHTKTSNAPNSSYFNNFVTPIQRRADQVPEYVMEICRKVLVSECKAADWVVGYDLNNDGVLDPATERNIKANRLGKALADASQTLNAARLAAGTTAKPALLAADRRYPRRIAFARNQYGALSFTQIVNNATSPPTPLGAAAKPLGIGCPLDATGSAPQNNGCRYPNKGESPTAGTHYGQLANNALWFRTTSNDEGQPGDIASAKYSSNRPLYYLSPAEGGTKLILPDTLCFTRDNIVPCGAAIPAPATQVNLNLPTFDVADDADTLANNKASDYTLCLDANSGDNSGFSQKYTVSTIGGTGKCHQDAGGDNDPRDAIDAAYTTLSSFAPHIPSTSVVQSGGKIVTQTFAAVGPVTVIDLGNGSTVQSGAVLTLDGNSQPEGIFVIKSRGTTTFEGASGGVQLKLDGVDPNNVFWVQETGKLDFEDAPAANPHRVAGNFLGKNAVPELGSNTNIEGGRFLGYTTVPSPGTFTFTAVTADGQPPVVPVLQLQATTNAPGSQTTDNIMASSSVVANTKWLPPADTNGTTYNVVVASGDTPGRVGANVPTGGEPGPGLPSFVHFLENWTGVDSNISGSFIQFKRSSLATAPAQPLFAVDTNNASSLFGYPQGYRTGNSGGAGGSADLGKIPFYEPPNRNWGFDVALLTQLPDLFAQRFTLPPAGAPDEFFREVGRDDRWVEALMCAAAASDRRGGTGATYTNYAIPDPSQRPARCQTATANYPAN